MGLDPIAELVRDLERDGRPSLAWVTRWSQHDVEPVATAWATSRDIVAMVGLLSLAPGDASLDATRDGLRAAAGLLDDAVRDDARMDEASRCAFEAIAAELHMAADATTGRARLRRFVQACWPSGPLAPAPADPWSAAAATALRRAVRVPPTLDQLLAAYRAR